MSPTNQMMTFIWNPCSNLKFYLDVFMTLLSRKTIFNAFRVPQLLFWKLNTVHFGLNQTCFTFTFPRSKKMNWFKLGAVIAAPCCICTFIAFSHGIKSVTADTSQPNSFHQPREAQVIFRLNLFLRCFPTGFPLKRESCIKLYGLIQDDSHFPGSKPNIKRFLLL